jgi:hypothetical protein
MTREMDLSPTEAGFCLQWHMVVYRSIVYQWLFSSVDVRETILNYRRNAANVKNTLKENEIFIEVVFDFRRICSSQLPAEMNATEQVYNNYLIWQKCIYTVHS